jgi:hypothetical protein
MASSCRGEPDLRVFEQDEARRGAMVKQVSFASEVLRTMGRFAAFSGVLAVVLWITWVMLDLKHLQSGFTLP